MRSELPSLEGGDTLLLCLDAVTLAADSDAAPYESAWSGAAARLVAQARAMGCTVAHALSGRPGPGASAWRPVHGLAPRPGEAVYHRDEPSAFASAPFDALAESLPDLAIVLCGVSTRGSFLATALDAARRGLRLTLAEDAAWMAPAERDGVDALLRLRRLGIASAPALRTCRAELLIAGPRLRVVEGGGR